MRVRPDGRVSMTFTPPSLAPPPSPLRAQDHRGAHTKMRLVPERYYEAFEEWCSTLPNLQVIAVPCNQFGAQEPVRGPHHNLRQRQVAPRQALSSALSRFSGV